MEWADGLEREGGFEGGTVQIQSSQLSGGQALGRDDEVSAPADRLGPPSMTADYLTNRYLKNYYN